MTDKKARWARVKHIRVRIMQEAYDLADRDDSEGYNSVKVMCSDVLAMINKLLDECQPEHEPIAWAYPEGLEALKSGRPWTVYGSSGDGRIPLYLNDAVAQRVEPRSGESGAGFESLPASPQWKGLTNQEALNAAVYVFCQLADSPEEQKQIARDLGKACNEPHSALMRFAATIEELLEEKNR